MKAELCFVFVGFLSLFARSAIIWPEFPQNVIGHLELEHLKKGDNHNSAFPQFVLIIHMGHMRDVRFNFELRVRNICASYMLLFSSGRLLGLRGFTSTVV